MTRPNRGPRLVEATELTAHPLDGAHLELVEDLHLPAEHGEGFVIEIHLTMGAFPELVSDGETGIHAFQ